MGPVRLAKTSAALAVALAVIGGAGAAEAGAPTAADAAALVQGITACRAVKDTGARIACYDGLKLPAHPGLLPAPPAMPQATAAPPAPATNAPKVAEAPQAAQPAPAKTLPDTSASLLKTRKVELVIAQVGYNAKGKLRLVMNDGVPWDQSDARHLEAWPKVGERVKITRSFLGYTCRLNEDDFFKCVPPNGVTGKRHNLQ